MNQILYTGGKNKKSGINDTHKIVVFFVIFIIVFAICIVGLGANLLSKVKNKNDNDVPGQSGNVQEPEKEHIEIKFEIQLGGIKLTIIGEKTLENVTYWWDEEEATTVEPGNTKYETVIPSKQGTHTLNIEVVDQEGNKKTANQLVIGDTEPELEITTDRISNYVIKAKDDEEVDRIVITLNGETTEVKVNAKEYEHKVPIPTGYSLIDVTVYNLNDISVNKKAKITNYKGQN